MKRFSFFTAALATTAFAFAGTPTIDGTLDGAAGYTNLTGTTAANAKEGFGPNIDASEIWFTSDASNLYYFIRAKADTSNGNGILFLLNTSKETGAAAGTSLGNVSGHALGGANPNWKMEFEVDHAWVGNPGGGATDFWVDQASYVGTPAGSFFGNVQQNGTAVNGSSGTQAFNNTGGSTNGWEFSIPRTFLNNVTFSDTHQVFAIVVSSDAYFSDDSAPATISTGNAGHNADFGSITGTQSVSPTLVPVSVSRFAIE